MDSKQKWIASLGFFFFLVSRNGIYKTLIKYICYRLTRLIVSLVTGALAMTFTHGIKERYYIFLPLHMQSVKLILTMS